MDAAQRRVAAASKGFLSTFLSFLGAFKHIFRGPLVPWSAPPMVFLGKGYIPYKNFHRIWSISWFSEKASIPTFS